MEYLKYNVRLMQLGGLYKVKNPGVILWKLICSFSVGFFMISSFVDTLNNRQLGFNELAINYINIGVGMIVFFRINYFYLYQNKSEHLVKNMNEIFMYSTRTGLQEKSMRGYVNIVGKINWTFLIGSIFFGESFAVAFMILKNDFKNRKLPYPMWYPYDYRPSPIYEITCVLQLISHLVIILLECGMDTFYVSSLLLTIGQFELLGWEFRNVFYSALLDCGLEKEQVEKFQRLFTNKEHNHDKLASLRLTLETKLNFDDVFETITSDVFDNCLTNKFKKLVRFHQELKSYCNDLEDFFSPVMLVFTLVFTLITLFSLYFMMNTNDNSVRIVFGGYFLLIPMDIFLTCSIGQLLTSQSEQLQNDTYEMPWYLCSEAFKSNFKIVQVGIKEPVALTIGKFTALSLSTALWILRTGFSYTAVLRQVTE